MKVLTHDCYSTFITITDIAGNYNGTGKKVAVQKHAHTGDIVVKM